MSDNNFVNITIVTYNRLSATRRCIESVLATADYAYVLTVVDNGSRDGTVEWLQEQKAEGQINNLILHPVNKGVARAANDGWEAEPARYYMKLDNDIIMQKQGWLSPMARVLDQRAEVGAVAYNVEPISYPVVEIGGLPLRIKNGNLGGCCIMIPERIHRELGFWCEDYGLYGEEDTDYGLRIMLAGYLNAYMEDEAAAVQWAESVDTEYRSLKDREREKNWSDQGAAKQNLLDYVSGARKLYVPRSAR